MSRVPSRCATSARSGSRLATSSGSGRPAGERTGGGVCSGAANADDLDLEGAARALIAHDVAWAVPEQRLPERGGRRQRVERIVRLFDRADEVARRVVLTFHLDLDDRAGSDHVAGRTLDHHGGLEHLLQLPDACLVVALLVLRRVVVGVLTDVPVLSGSFEGGGDLRSTLAGALVELLLQAREGLLRKVGAFHSLLRLPAGPDASSGCVRSQARCEVCVKDGEIGAGR